MSTNPTYQIQKLNEVRLSDAEEKLYRYALANDASTYKEAAAATGLSLSCVCGRFGDLAEKGMMWNEKQSKGPLVLHATNVPRDIRRNKYLYEADKDKKDFATLKVILARLRGRNKIDTPDLPKLYSVIRNIDKNV